MELVYPGKLPLAQILATPKADAVDLWTPAGAVSSLLFGENLSLLAHLRCDPAIRGQVQLIYIDPPYATETVFHTRLQAHAYDDVHRGHEFVEFLRQRLVFMHDLLAEDGSLYVHLDEKAVSHVRIILDEVFGRSNYRNCIVRKKCNPKNFTRKQYGNVSDYILFYTKSESYVWNRPYEPWTEDRAGEYQYVESESGRRFMKVPVHAPGTRNGATGQAWRGKLPPPGKHWQYPPETLDAMDARGELYWSSSGNPRRKVYLDQSPGIGVQDIWLDYRDAHNQNIAVTGYPTEKSPELLRRIVQASSNAQGLVLDAFAGSGTTLEVAQTLGRRWIGMTIAAKLCERFLAASLTGQHLWGTSKKGQVPSAGFPEGCARVLEIAPPPS